MKQETKEYFVIKPHFYASLIGSLFASSDLENGNELSELDMFSSKKFYIKLSQMYKPWRNSTNYTLTDYNNHIISNAAGLYMPWMNTLAGKNSPESRNISDVLDVFEKLIYHITEKERNYMYSSFEWDGILLDFQLRLGSKSFNLIEELLSPIIKLMKDYQDNFYDDFWKAREYSFYKGRIDNFLKSQTHVDLKNGIETIRKWISNSLPINPVIICLNRFLGSIDPDIEYNSGFGLHGSHSIHIAPKFLVHLDLLLHEIFHSLVYESKILTNSEEIKNIANQISSHLINDKSPVPFWNWQEIYSHEIEEIFADFVAGEIYKEIKQINDYQSSYAKSDKFLLPIYNRLLNYSSILKQKGLKELVSSSLANWNFENDI